MSILLQVAFYFYLFILSVYTIVSVALAVKKYRPQAIGGHYAPKTLVMVPCKGEDLTLKENLASLANQNYSNYDIVAIVDSKTDKAMESIKAAGIKFITTDPKYNRGSGKVNALSSAISQFKNYEVYAIADSDILAKPDWLSNLVRPLHDPRYGLSTTFPYFKPADKKFWSKVKMVWGFVGQGMMESKTLIFGWGGSLAFRKNLIKDKISFDFFSGSLSDDIAITKLCKSKRLLPYYVESAQPIVNVSETYSTFTEWANRQTALSIHGDRKVFALGIVSYAMSIITLISAVILSIFFSLFALVFFLPFIVGSVKSYKRLRFSTSGFFVINTMMPFIFLANLLKANSMQSITWRGREYEF